MVFLIYRIRDTITAVRTSMIFTVFRLWLAKLCMLRRTVNFWLLGVALAAAGCRVHGSDAPVPSTAQQELHAAKLVEATVFAGNPTPETRETMRRTYERLEAKYPCDAAIKIAFGEFLWKQDERAQAVAKWEAAERLEPANGAVLNQLGGAHLAAGAARPAFDYFSRAVQCDPANAIYRTNVANVAFMFRHKLAISEERAFEVARQEFAEASRLAPASEEYARAYAEVFYALPQPDWTRALAAWERFHALTRDKEFALVNLARVHMKLGNSAAARACLCKVESPDYQRVKSKLLDRIGARSRGTRDDTKMPQRGH